MPAPLAKLDPKVVVADVIVSEKPTALLRHAQACGCPTMSGQSMLEGQIDEMLRFFGIG
jgi:shikimate dehydrogenase